MGSFWLVGALCWTWQEFPGGQPRGKVRIQCIRGQELSESYSKKGRKEDRGHSTAGPLQLINSSVNSEKTFKLKAACLTDVRSLTFLAWPDLGVMLSLSWDSGRSPSGYLPPHYFTAEDRRAHWALGHEDPGRLLSLPSGCELWLLSAEQGRVWLPISFLWYLAEARIKWT